MTRLRVTSGADSQTRGLPTELRFDMTGDWNVILLSSMQCGLGCVDNRYDLRTFHDVDKESHQNQESFNAKKLYQLVITLLPADYLNITN